jgi:molybdopterin molybdotransferase
MTGAPLPGGADAVIMVEETKKVEGLRLKVEGERDEPKDEFVEVLREIRPGENIRRAGGDIRKGELALEKGKVIGPAEIGLLASLGIDKAPVIRAPEVAILATGDELLEVNEALVPGKIRSSNSYTLYGQVLRYGGIPVDLGIVRDVREEIKAKVESGLDYDLLLTSGGVSVGDYDLVKDIFAGLGMEMKFRKIAMKPGKPSVFGLIRGKPVFGLPGNPVSSMVVFEQFVAPAILKMSGKTGPQKLEVSAILKEDINKQPGRRHFLRAWVEFKDGRYWAKTTGPQGSGILRSMSLANALMIIPEGTGEVKAGEEVRVQLWDYPGQNFSFLTRNSVGGKIEVN